jgi:hypothetical protein
VDGFLRSEILSLETQVMTYQLLGERILDEALPGLVMMLPAVLIVATAFSLVVVVVNQLANARRLPEFGILHATGRSKRWLMCRLTLETSMLALTGWAVGIGLSYVGLHLVKVTVFAAQGHDLNYPAWLPVVFSMPIPAVIAGFTFLAVRRTLTRLDPVAIVERRELSTEALSQTASLSRVNSKSSPRPLAPATFYRRHRRRAVLLIGVMGLMTMAVVLFIFALAVDADARESFLGYLSRVSMVRSPGLAASLDPEVVAQLKAHPAVERVIPIDRYHMLNVTIPPFASAQGDPFAVYAHDLAYLVELYGLQLKDGHLPRPGTNEMVIPEALAQNRDLAVGDVIGDPDHPAYPNAPSLDPKFVVSGIFARPTAPEDGSGLGFVSLEFLESQETYDAPDLPGVLVVPEAGQKSALDEWLEMELAGSDASVSTHLWEVDRIRKMARQDILSIALLEGLIAVVAAIGLAVLNHVFTSQRHAEFGVLHALGYGRQQLVGRVLRETAFMMGIAWALTAILCLAAIFVLRFGVFAPLGLTFNLFNITPWLYTLPIPIAALTVTTGTTARTLYKLDAVSIIERR